MCTFLSLPPLIVLIYLTLQVSLFIGLVDGSTSLYGLKENTLDSLVLTILPPKHHTFQTCKYNITGSKHIVIDSDEDIQVFFLNKLLQAIQHSAGFRIPTVSHFSTCTSS